MSVTVVWICSCTVLIMKTFLQHCHNTQLKDYTQLTLVLWLPSTLVPAILCDVSMWCVTYYVSIKIHKGILLIITVKSNPVPLAPSWPPRFRRMLTSVSRNGGLKKNKVYGQGHIIHNPLPEIKLLNPLPYLSLLIVL